MDHHGGRWPELPSWTECFVAHQDMKLREVIHKMTRQALKVHFNLCEDTSKCVWFLFHYLLSLPHPVPIAPQGIPYKQLPETGLVYRWFYMICRIQRWTTAVLWSSSLASLRDRDASQSSQWAGHFVVAFVWMRSKPKIKISTAMGYSFGQMTWSKKQHDWEIGGKKPDKGNVQRHLWVCKEMWWRLCFMSMLTNNNDLSNGRF